MVGLKEDFTFSMRFLQQTGLAKGSRLIVAISLLSLTLLLAACGDSGPADSDYTVYVPGTLQLLNNVPSNITDQLINPSAVVADSGVATPTAAAWVERVSDRKVQVYYSTDQLTAQLQPDYSTQMVTNRHWTDVSTGVLASDALTGGTVVAYEKTDSSNPSIKHVVGVIFLSTDVKSDTVNALRSTNSSASAAKTLVVIVQGATGEPTPGITPK